MKFERGKRRHSHIDVAPMVDVVFNLLLFFVITYNVTADSGIRIHLPQARTAELQTTAPLVIAVTASGEVYAGDQPVAMEALAGLVRDHMEGVAVASVRIKADRAAQVEALIKVVDAVRLGGCSAFSIITEP